MSDLRIFRSWPFVLSFSLFIFSRIFILTWNPVYSDTLYYFNLSWNSWWNSNFIIYRDHAFPYPFLSWLWIQIPFLVQPSANYEIYRLILRISFFLVEAVSVFAFYFFTRKDKNLFRKTCTGVGLYTVLSFCLGDLIYDRLDILIVLSFVLVFISWNFSGNNEWKFLGGLFVGFFVKIIPAFLWPFKAFELFRQSFRKGLIFCGIPVAFLILLLSSEFFIYPGQIKALQEHSLRGIQIESTWALPFLIGKTYGWVPEVSIVDHLGAQEINPANIPVWYLYASKYLGFLFLLGLMIWAFFQKKSFTDVLSRSHLFLVFIFSFFTLQRVLSPQFLLWAPPFLAISLGYQWRWSVALLSACLYILSYVCFTVGYSNIVYFDPLFVNLLAIRNSCLSILFFIFCRDFFRITRP